MRATAADVSRQLRQIQQEASGGRADVGGIEQSVRHRPPFNLPTTSLPSKFHWPMDAACGSSELATVSDTVTEQRSAALLNGQPVVGFEIVRARGAGEVDVWGMRATLEKLKADNPDITITEAFNFVDPVIENFNGSMALLIEGGDSRRDRRLALFARLAGDHCVRHCPVNHPGLCLG